MKILWIGQKPYDGGGGEEVVDKKLKSALRARGHDVDDLHIRPVSRVKEVLNLGLRGMPYYRHRFESRASFRAVRDISPTYDVAVASWEPFDRLALASPVPVVLLLHNITSAAIRSVFPTHPLARYLARRAERSERTVYSDPRLRAIAVLSRTDQAYVKSIAPDLDVLYTPPGMPPIVPLHDQAQVVPELLVSGTYGWFPKRRDVVAFAREYAALSERMPVFASGLPADADALLASRPPVEADTSSAIRFGLITDRFESGHKLKTTYYLANNAFVLSFADVSSDYEGIEDSRYFVRHITSVDDIARHVNEVRADDPARVRERLRAFQQRCAEVFSWQRSGDVLERALVGEIRHRAAHA